jgi:NADH-quinone oxidoreductase subunit H
MAKMFAFVFLYLLIRWTIPRFRFDQLMTLAWKTMIPLALANLVGAMAVRQYGLSPWVMTLVSLGLFVLAGAISVRTNSSITAPKRRVISLPPGLPAGVTYASR